MQEVKSSGKFIIHLLAAAIILYGCVSPYQPTRPSPSGGLKTTNWADSEKQTFNNQCNSEMKVLRLDLSQNMITQYCDCAFSQVEERYTFQELRIDIGNDPQIKDIDQICSIEANLPPDPAEFGGPSFGGVCDNSRTYEEKIICLGLPAPVLPFVPWRR
jgi:hypothetical protein